MFKNKNLFTILTQFLIIVLPFYVILAVFFSTELGINKAGFFIKELVLVVLFFSLIYEFIKKKIFPRFELLDYLIFLYFGYGVIITLINGLGFDSIIYGGRYDYIFLFVFLIYRHGSQFLKASVNNLVILFLYSGSASLLLSILIKFRLGEDALLIFGFTEYVSNWIYTGGIPNYHGLENSGIRRFQGIFDGPNQMAFYIILYTSLILFLQKKKIQFHIIFTLIFLLGLLIMTYSRSALLGIGVGVGLLFLLNIKYLYKKYKKQLLSGIILSTILLGGIGYIFNEKIYNIVVRPSSTVGHSDRMEIGYNRFIEKPMGSGLAEAGPAYRNIYPDKQNKKAEEYYIPESWFIQQLIEGGIIFFSLFIAIFITILTKLYKKSKSLFAGLIAILIMNIFLHIFEATYLSILLFIFIGMIVRVKYAKG